MRAFPKMVIADVPNQEHLYYLVNRNYDFIPEVKEFLDWKSVIKRAPATVKHIALVCYGITAFSRNEI